MPVRGPHFRAVRDAVRRSGVEDGDPLQVPFLALAQATDDVTEAAAMVRKDAAAILRVRWQVAAALVVVTVVVGLGAGTAGALLGARAERTAYRMAESRLQAALDRSGAWTLDRWTELIVWNDLDKALRACRPVETEGVRWCWVPLVVKSGT